MATKKGYRSWADLKACLPGESGGCCPEFQTNSLVNDLQEILNLVDSDSIEVEYLLDGSVTFHVIGDSGTFNLTLAPIGSVPNANAATLIGDILNLEPADVNFAGIVTASDTIQRFHGQKDFESHVGYIMEGWSDFATPGVYIPRFIMDRNGQAIWYVNNGVAECGSIGYGTPFGTPGVLLRNAANTGRAQIKMYTSAGGFSLGALTTNAIADNMIVILPDTGRTFVTGFTADTSIAGMTPVVDEGYLFNVEENTKLKGQLNLGTTIDFADNAAALVGGLVVGDVYRTNDFLKIVH